MSVYKIKIKEESLPTRCEICHKADYFNPVTLQCIRCGNIIPEEINRSDELSFTNQKNLSLRDTVISVWATFIYCTFSPTAVLPAIAQLLLHDIGGIFEILFASLFLIDLVLNGFGGNIVFRTIDLNYQWHRLALLIPVYIHFIIIKRIIELYKNIVIKIWVYTLIAIKVLSFILFVLCLITQYK